MHYETGEPFVLSATASLIGERFARTRLDTLVLSMPISFKGALVQSAGRLHRPHEAKADPVIFDYLDEDHAITNAMFRRRSAGYRELGYQIEMPVADVVSGLFEREGGDAKNGD